MAPQSFAESYRVVIIPDNIVSDTLSVDSFIYNASAEFFADGVSTILSGTDYIKSPTVSEVRELIKKDPSANLAAKALTSKFKSSYNVDYLKLKKIASGTNSRYVLLITSYVDAENYVMRRTPWDLLNVPGAAVVDPAYKISTYAVLVDTFNNRSLWSDTYYKTISTCEGRILTRGASPQTEQLQKIKDYSRYLCPQIAQQVQVNVLPPNVLAKETKQVYYDIGNIDNVFTKKYRHLGKETNKVYKVAKTETKEFIDETKVKANDTKEKIKKNVNEKKVKIAEKRKARLEAKEAKKQAQLEVKAVQVKEEKPLNDISNKTKEQTDFVKNAIFKRKQEAVQPVNNINYYQTSDFDIKKSRKNNLYGRYDSDKPQLRDYYNAE